MKNFVLVLGGVLLAALCGCSRSEQASKSNEFFVTWLQNHGESNIVMDASGVGLKGNATRLRFSLYGSDPSKNGGWSAELEFRVRIPDGQEIVEYVSGTGDTLEKAENDAKVNFVLSTFHVVYRSFMNPSDPHQQEESIIIDGKPRALVLGDCLTRGQTTNSAPDMFPLREDFRKILASQSLSPQTHWVKIVYANHQSKLMLCAVTLDNQDSPAMTAAVKDMPWPKKEEFYMVKQFLVVK